MPQPAIHVENVWKKFRRGEMHDSLRELIPAIARRLVGRGGGIGELSGKEFWALQDVTFEVPRGQCLGIIGPNGAGKSTMLKLLSRIIRPNRGSYHVNGRVSALIEVGAGFHQDLNGRENIYLNGTILGMSRAEIRAKEEQIIEFSGVQEFIETPVKRYSSGMKARLGFAVAAHLSPDVLLVDEVLSVGDAKFRNKCVRHMRDLIRSDVTVVFISHLLDQVRSLCPNTLVLDHGKVIYNGATDGAIRAYLDCLSDDVTPSGRPETTDADIRDITFRDEDGHELLQMRGGKPAIIEFDLVVRRALENPVVLINISSVGGQYLGTFNTRRSGVAMPTAPGTHRLRVMLDPMPLADGDYVLEFKIHAGSEGQNVVWAPRYPRMVSVRGAGGDGAYVHFHGSGEVIESQSAAPTNALADPVKPAVPPQPAKAT